MIFGKTHKLDTTPSIQAAISQHLEKENWKVILLMGFTTSGENALIIQGLKEKFVIMIYLENDAK